MTDGEFYPKIIPKVCKKMGIPNWEKENPGKLLEKISAPSLMIKEVLDVLPAYSSKKNKKLYLEEPFSTGKHVRLLKVRGEQLVVKWYLSSERNTSYECSVYKRLKKSGCPLPYFDISYEFWGHPVLVMEKLDKLGKHENIYQLGREVLQQLKHLHEFAVHNDIKPANILKRVENGKTSYFLIDYGGVSKESLKYGFKRWIWTKHFTSQPPHTKKQVTTPRHDFKELGYTMNFLKDRSNDNYWKNFSGRLKKYMDRVKKVDKTNVRKRDYKDLIAILS